MGVLIGIGVAATLLGLAGIVWSVVLVLRARRAGLDDAALRARIGRALPLNIGALLMSFLGLACVAVGALLS